MPALLSQFLAAAGTYRPLEAHRVAVRTQGRQQVVPCADPGCSAAACIQGEHIVCTALQDCTWRAGTVVDYLGRRFGWSVRETLARIYEHGAEKIDERLGRMPWATAHDTLTLECERRRAILQFLIDRRGEPTLTTPEMARMLDALRGQGIDLRRQQLTYWLLSPGDCAALAALVGKQTGTPVDYPYPCGALVRPMLADFTTLSHIDLHPIEKRFPMLSWDLEPTDVAFSGLWELRGGDTAGMTVLRKARVAAALTQQARTLGRAHTYVGLDTRPEAEQPSRVKLTCVRYLAGPDDPLPTLLAVKTKTTPGGFSVGYLEAPETAYTWLEFLTHRFDRYLRRELNPGAVQRDLELLTLTPEERQEWGELLRTRQLAHLLDYLDQHAALADTQFEVRGAQIGETAAGYFISREKDGRHPVTNFTLSFQRNVFFPDSQLLCHLAHVHFRGDSYPVMLTSEQLGKPALLTRAVQQAVARRSPAHTALPNLLDAGLAGLLSIHFNTTVADLTTLTGVSRLGWSADRTRFAGPHWQAEAAQVLWRDTWADPAAGLLSGYDFTPGAVEPASGAPSKLAGELLAWMVASAARVLRARPTYPLAFRDTPATRRTLTALFARAFRQTGAVLWQAKTSPRELAGLHGYPCLVTGTLEGALTAGPPIFLLTDAGRVLEEPLTEEDADIISVGFSESMHWLLRADTVPLEFRQTPLYGHDLLAEGCQILEAACGYRWTGLLAELPAVEAWLGRLPPGQLGDVFRENFSAQRLLFCTAQCPEDLRPLVLAELAQLDATFCPGEYASLDLVQGRSLLKSFYREELILPAIATATPDAAAWALRPSLAS